MKTKVVTISIDDRDRAVLDLFYTYVDCIHREPFKGEYQRWIDHIVKSLANEEGKKSLITPEIIQAIKRALIKSQRSYYRFVREIRPKASKLLMSRFKEIYHADCVRFENRTGTTGHLMIRAFLKQFIKLYEQKCFHNLQSRQLCELTNTSNCISDDKKIVKGVIKKRLVPPVRKAG